MHRMDLKWHYYVNDVGIQSLETLRADKTRSTAIVDTSNARTNATLGTKYMACIALYYEKLNQVMM